MPRNPHDESGCCPGSCYGLYTDNKREVQREWTCSSVWRHKGGELRRKGTMNLDLITLGPRALCSGRPVEITVENQQPMGSTHITIE